MRHTLSSSFVSVVIISLFYLALFFSSSLRFLLSFSISLRLSQSCLVSKLNSHTLESTFPLSLSISISLSVSLSVCLFPYCSLAFYFSHFLSLCVMLHVGVSAKRGESGLCVCVSKRERESVRVFERECMCRCECEWVNASLTCTLFLSLSPVLFRFVCFSHVLSLVHTHTRTYAPSFIHRYTFALKHACTHTWAFIHWNIYHLFEQKYFAP